METGAPLRKILPGATVIGLFMILPVLPAFAAAGPAYAPPNEGALLGALIKNGRIPRATPREQQLAMLQAYLGNKLGAKPDDDVLAAPRAGTPALSGRTSWGRAIAHTRGVTNDTILVILVEFSPDD